MFDGVFHSPNSDEIWRILLRWFHFRAVYLDRVALLFQPGKRSGTKRLDAETKKKVNPDLLGRRFGTFAGARSSPCWLV
jgi:hypothetical protein